MSNDNDFLVKVEGVSKKFCRDLKKSLCHGVKDVASELLPFGKGAGRREQGDASEEAEQNREALSEHSKFKIKHSAQRQRPDQPRLGRHRNSQSVPQEQ